MIRVALDATEFVADGTLQPQSWGGEVTLQGFGWLGEPALLVYDTQSADHGIGVSGGAGDQIDFSQTNGDVAERLAIDFDGLVDNVTLALGDFEGEEDGGFETGVWTTYDDAGRELERGTFSPLDGDLGANVSLPGTAAVVPITLKTTAFFSRLEIAPSGYDDPGSGDDAATAAQNSGFNVSTLAFDRVPGQVFMEYGQVRADYTGATVTLEHRFDNPVVFLTINGTNGGEPATARVTDIGADGFSFFIQEPEVLGGWHAKENISYVVVEAGVWELNDGTVIEAGSVASGAVAPRASTEVAFRGDFSDRPAIFSQVQSVNDPTFVITRQASADADGVELALQKEEALNGAGHAVETIGWLAVGDRNDVDTSDDGPSYATEYVPVLDGLVASYSADERVKWTEDGQVAAWLDTSGWGNNLTAQGDPRIVDGQTPSGLPAIVFDGEGDWLSRTTESGDSLIGLADGNGARTMFFVVNYLGDNDVAAGLTYGDGEDNEAFGLVSGSADENLIVQGWGETNDASSDVSAVPQGWMVQSVVLQDDVFNHYVNGVLVDSGTQVFETDVRTLVMGGEIAGLGEGAMEVAAAHIYRRALTEEERQDVEGFLQEKYLGVDEVWAGSVDVDHEWQTVAFDRTLEMETSPTLLAALATTNGADTAVAQVNAVTNGSMQLRVQEEPSLDEEFLHEQETIDVLVLDGRAGQLTGTAYDDLL